MSLMFLLSTTAPNIAAFRLSLVLCNRPDHSTSTCLGEHAVHTIQVYVLLQRRLGRQSVALHSPRVYDLQDSSWPHRLEPFGSTHAEPLCHTNTSTWSDAFRMTENYFVYTSTARTQSQQAKHTTGCTPLQSKWSVSLSDAYFTCH